MDEIAVLPTGVSWDVLGETTGWEPLRDPARASLARLSPKGR